MTSWSKMHTELARSSVSDRGWRVTNPPQNAILLA
jgi:hypothetical protein